MKDCREIVKYRKECCQYDEYNLYEKKRTFPAVRIAAALLLPEFAFLLTAAASEGAPRWGRRTPML